MRYRVLSWDLVPGDRLSRQRLHDRFGGNRQRGIAPSRQSPNVLLFSDPRAGARHGYQDDLSADPIVYYGEGRVGDQEMTPGNKGILQHRKGARDLRLFHARGSEVEYLGRYEVDLTEPFTWQESHQSELRQLRKVVVFFISVSWLSSSHFRRGSSRPTSAVSKSRPSFHPRPGTRQGSSYVDGSSGGAHSRDVRIR